MGAASICCSVITLSIVNLLNGDKNPEVLTILFLPMLVGWLFFSRLACSYREDKSKPISANLFFNMLAGSFLMQFGFPIWIIGSPYFISRYFRERKYL